MCVEKRQALWEELKKQKAILEEQKERVYQQYQKLVAAVLEGRIEQWEEVKDLLFELLEFGDYYVPARELRQELSRYICQHFSAYVEKESALTRVLIEDNTN